MLYIILYIIYTYIIYKYILHLIHNTSFLYNIYQCILYISFLNVSFIYIKTYIMLSFFSKNYLFFPPRESHKFVLKPINDKLFFPSLL